MGIRYVVIIVSVFGLGLMATESLYPSLSSVSRPQSTTKTIIVQMSYFAQPGKEDEVYRIRMRACDALEKAGTTRGRVMRRLKGPREGSAPDSLADVVWQGEFTDDTSFAKYEEIAENDPGFLAARRQMGMAARRAERRYFEIR